MNEIKESQKTVTLFEMNQRPGEILREVYFTKESVVVTKNGKPIAEIRSIPKQKDKRP